jgi:hypothetical protein
MPAPKHGFSPDRARMGRARYAKYAKAAACHSAMVTLRRSPQLTRSVTRDGRRWLEIDGRPSSGKSALTSVTVVASRMRGRPSVRYSVASTLFAKRDPID